MKKRIIAMLLIIFIVLTVLVVVKYQMDIRASYERVLGKSSMVSTPYGDIEYTEGGAGPDVLVIHGGGGGYDQGELLARTVLGDGFRWIAPSRFGYLGSSLPEEATYDDQADAYIKLLDHLKVEKVAVVALSIGGPSALLLALKYPERVSSLTLVSAGATNVSDQEGKQGDKQGKMISKIMQSDVLYWATTNLFKKQFLQLMGANKEVIAALSPEQIEIMDQFIDYMNPAALRKSGAAFDHIAALPNERIAGIRIPTLVVHAKDDTLMPYKNAVFSSSTIPGARLLSFEKGGHLVMAIEEPVIRKEVYEHINISNTLNDIKKVEKVKAEDLSKYFVGYEGCFVLFDKNNNEYTVFNEPKSQKQVSPCSTFKVVNALVGLETKVLTDENTTFKWDGTIYSNRAWNNDQTLSSAISNSTFWYFQQNASKIGLDRMQDYLNRINYGNKNLSGGITEFWQQSALKISPREQVEILKRIYAYQVPISKTNIDIVKKVLVLSNENGTALSGKTGSGLKNGKFLPQGKDDEYVNGWFIGYVERNNNVYFFATNIEADKKATGSVAKDITLRILKDKALY